MSEEKMAPDRFMELCAALPLDTHWGDAITPDIVAHIWQAALPQDAMDAARYRWLKAQSDGRPFYFHGVGHKYPENLDAAIDAAISAQD